ncbi:MAG: hypothetical protein ABS43_02340 [Bordetella sp. SCN 67-23]|nr:hypothetical protein [Burkholderiales bacterium]ODS76145.1 MAG: hypothetical protein ABS43_02340 [Bordetella sp. SCN 67-23]ODU73709.1 MAG: hypothetical protein ABT00_16525 [Bordetella sp. SCN 68-11]OJW93704.1 MAG: hypothetical protein BGO71_17520 [Burkholderiales bacterium 67-32]
MHFSFLVAIGWLYVTLLMSLAQPTVLAGIATLLFYGLLPVSILLYIFTAPMRKRLRRAREAARDTPENPDQEKP